MPPGQPEMLHCFAATRLVARLFHKFCMRLVRCINDVAGGLKNHS